MNCSIDIFFTDAEYCKLIYYMKHYNFNLKYAQRKANLYLINNCLLEQFSGEEKMSAGH